MILVLQTTIPGLISVWLVKDRIVFSSRSMAVKWHGSDRALVLVGRMLRSKNKTLGDVTSIVVVRGPGSFTAVRTGLIIANTLGMFMHIPIRGMVTKHRLTTDEVLRQAGMAGKQNTLIRPWYGKSPNITRAPVPRPVRPGAPLAGSGRMRSSTFPKLKRSQARAKR